MTPAETPEVDTLSRPGLVVRVAIAALLLGILLTAQLGRHDNWFPLGMLGQYGVARDPEGTVIDTYLVGHFGSRGTETIALRTDTVGITRVELETSLPQLQESPAPMTSLKATYERRHPGRDLSALEVRQRVHRLEGGARQGPAQDRTVLRQDFP